MFEPSPAFLSGLRQVGRPAAVVGLGVLAMTLGDGIAAATDGARPPASRETSNVPQRPIGVWRETRPLLQERTWPSANVLADGRVLLVGGKRAGASGGVSAGVELWDPRSETTTALPPMAVARHEHTATVLPGGRVAVVGGVADADRKECHDRVEVLEAIGEKWSWKEGPRLKQARCRHAAVALPDGRLMVLGGQDCHAARGLTSVETWDGKTGIWKEEAPLPEPAADRYVVPRAYLLTGGSVLVLGAGAKTFLWDPRSGRWSAGPTPGSVAAPFHAELVSTQLRDGTVVAVLKVLGKKATMYALAPSADRWRELGPAPPAAALGRGEAVGLHDGSVLFLGPLSVGTVDLLSDDVRTVRAAAPPFGDTSGSRLVALSDGRAVVLGSGLSQIWDRSVPTDGTWTMRSTRGLPAGGHPVPGGGLRGAAVLPDGRVFESYGRQSRVWDPRLDSYLPQSQTQTDRDGGLLAVLPDGRVLVAGGVDRQVKSPKLEESVRSPDSLATVFLQVHTKSAELFAPNERAWSATGPLTEFRINPASAVLADGRVLAAGGTEEFWGQEIRDGMTVRTNKAPDLASAEIWSAADRRWRPVAPMSMARSASHTALLADGRVFVVGGTYLRRSEPEVYDPRTNSWSKPPGSKPWGTSAAAVRLRDGRVLVVEGRAPEQGQGVPRFEAALWSPATAQWTATAPPRYEVDGLTVTADGRIFHGGVQPEIWSPATGAWATATAPMVRSDIESCPPLGLQDGRVLMCLEIWSPESKDPHGN